MNKLYVGFAKDIELPKAGLFISDEIPKAKRARVFDPLKHSFIGADDRGTVRPSALAVFMLMLIKSVVGDSTGKRGGTLLLGVCGGDASAGC